MANRSITGYESKKNGEYFETLIEKSLESYKRKGIAHISKTPEPMRVIQRRSGGKFLCCFKKKSEPDFKGVLADGSCIIFDAKHTDKDRIQQGCITENQWQVYEDYERMNARCYVVVSVQFKNFYRIPWIVWKRMKELYGHKYMGKAELEAYKLDMDATRILLLDGIELN